MKSSEDINNRFASLAGVIELRFTAEDIGRIRFALSPAWETVNSVRAISTWAEHPFHANLRHRTGSGMAAVDMALLTALIRPSYVPDFLAPTPHGRTSTFEADLARIAETTPEVVAAQLSQLIEHPAAQRGGDRTRDNQLVRELIDDPRAGLARIVTELNRYWHAVMLPCWPRLRALLHADLTYRLEQLAAGGVANLLADLHPQVSFGDGCLTIRQRWAATLELRRRGLVLMPCVFAWPDVLVMTDEPCTPTMAYAARGIGRLWHDETRPHRTPLADVIGGSRAAILTLLDLPMSTTQLTQKLGLSAPTLNAHLKALQAAGIVTARRDGRSVLYRRTELGDLLLTSAP